MSCQNSCTAVCGNNCTGSCTGNCATECVTTCDGSCSQNCFDVCSSQCGGDCSYYCGNQCSGDCGETCQRDCGFSCSGESTIKSIYKITPSPGCMISCDSYCTGSNTNESRQETVNCRDNCVGGCKGTAFSLSTLTTFCRDCSYGCMTSSEYYTSEKCLFCSGNCVIEATKSASVDNAKTREEKGVTIITQGTDNCSACSSSCSGGTSSTKQSSIGSCSNSCAYACGSNCKDGCTGSCYTDCVGACGDVCTGNCSGLTYTKEGITPKVISQCEVCAFNCAGECMSNAAQSCRTNCTTYCSDACKDTCVNNCNDDCSKSSEQPPLSTRDLKILIKTAETLYNNLNKAGYTNIDSTKKGSLAKDSLIKQYMDIVNILYNQNISKD